MLKSSSVLTANQAKVPGIWGLLPPLVFFVLTRLAILLFLPPFFSDIPLYCSYASRGVDQGEIPYRDFAVEYPPLSYWIIALPRLVSSTPYSEKPGHQGYTPALTEYRRWFMVQMAVADLAAFACFVFLVRRSRADLQSLAAWGYALVGLLLAPVLYDRLDVSLLLLLMLGMLFVEFSRMQARGQLLWELLACLFLGFSIGLKWAPIVMTPYFLFGIFVEGFRWRRALIASLTVLAGALLPFLVHMPSAGWSVWDFLGFHAGRPIQIESIYATGVMVAAVFSPEIQVQAVHQAWGFDLVGAWSERLASISTIVLLAGYVGMMLWAFWHRSNFDRKVGLQAACLILLFTVTFSKVLSPQYFVWFLPIALWLGIGLLDYRGFALLLLAVCLVAALTTWIFPFNYVQTLHSQSGKPLQPFALMQGTGELREIYGPTAWILVVRNGLVLGITIWLSWCFLATVRNETDEPGTK